MTRICRREGCTHNGEPQPLEAFPLRYSHGHKIVGTFCYDCVNAYHKHKQREWRESKRWPYPTTTPTLFNVS